MFSFLFSSHIKICSTEKAEAIREKFLCDNAFCIALESSGKLARYENLKKWIESEEFKKKKRRLRRFTWKRRKPEERWEGSQEKLGEAEYKGLREDLEVKKYYILQEDRVFNEFSRWKLTFEDDFSGLVLNSTKWLTRYYAGEYLLNETYGVGNDVQLFKAENVSLQNGHLCLEFKSETVRGRYWDFRLGIIERKYAYTSGMVNTALSFRQKQGRFEAKMKISHSEINHCFWLSGDGLVPHVNIMKMNSSGFCAGCYMQAGLDSLRDSGWIKKVKLPEGYYIFGFEWTASHLVWKINDCVVKTTPNELPDIPLYAVFSFGATYLRENSDLPQQMQVEWVRFYAINDN